jgi:hypothetical protein
MTPEEKLRKERVEDFLSKKYGIKRPPPFVPLDIARIEREIALSQKRATRISLILAIPMAVILGVACFLGADGVTVVLIGQVFGSVPFWVYRKWSERRDRKLATPELANG